MYSKFVVIIYIIAISSCGLINLNRLEIVTSPSEVDEILSAEAEISLLFSASMEESRIESLFTLKGPSGIEEGDFRWDENQLFFTPSKKLQPGFRYKIEFKGEAFAADGRKFTKNILIPFYYITDEKPPILLSSSPPEASTVDVHQVIKMSFSKPMNTDIFEKNFRLSPSSAVIFEWDTDNTIVEIKPEKQWINMQVYTWSASAQLTDTADIPLSRAYNGVFLVQIDTSPPSVISCNPASDNGNGSFSVMQDLTLDELQQNEHFAVLFSEEINFQSLRQSFFIDPSIDGYLISLSPSSVLYYIEEKLPPESIYKLTIKEGLKDSSGNETADNNVICFSPDIRFQRITSIEIEDENGTYQTVLPADFNAPDFIDRAGLDYYGTDSLHFILNLSEPYPQSALEEKTAFESDITLSIVFPPGITAPELWSKAWETETRLRLIFKGLSSCQSDEPVYYKFNIKSGNLDSATPSGSYLENGVSFIFLGEID